MSDHITTIQPKDTRQQCRHVLVSGYRCQSPCLRSGSGTSGQHEPFCYYHHTSRRPAPHRHSNRLQTQTIDHSGGPTPFVLPHIEDQSSIQASVNEIVLRITLGDLDPRRAGLLLYAMQIASITLRTSQPSAQPTRNSSRTSNISTEPEIPTVDQIIDDPDLGLIAPIALYKEPEDRIPHKPSRWRRLLDELDKAKADEAAQAKAAEEAAREQAEEPAPTILPILQAQSALRGRRPLRGVWKLRAALPLAGHNLQLRPSGAPPRSGSKVTK